MSSELLELVKIQTNCEQTSSLPTHANAKLLSSHLTDLIVKNIQEKPKLNTYINFIRNIGRQHVRKQCVNVDNAAVYLKHLPFSSTTYKNEDLYLALPRADVQAEINEFYAQQALKKGAIFKRKATINAGTQQSFPSDFDFNVLTFESEAEPFSLTSNINLSESSELPVKTKMLPDQRREAEVKFVMAVVNLGQNSATIVDNILLKLSKYEILLQCEKDFLQWLLLKETCSVASVIEQFPFLLEEIIIDIATKHLQGKLDNGKDFQALEWVRSDMVIKKQAVEIIEALFAMGKYNYSMLNVLMRIFR